jgi:hypothetical protein
MILGVVCSLCLAVPPGTLVRSELPQRAPQLRLVSSQPESTLVARTAQAVAEHPFAVEVGNEPNLPRYWGTTITPSSYVSLYTRARNAARWVDPDVPVISAGIADTTGWKTWVKAIAQVQPDAIGLHPYVTPTASTRWALRFGRVAVTEVGIGREDVSEAYRLRYLQGVVASLRELGAWLTMLYSVDDPSWALPAGVLTARAKAPRQRCCRGAVRRRVVKRAARPA